MNANIEVFNNRAMSVMQGIAELAKQKKQIETQDKKMREELQALCEEYEIVKIDNEYVSITQVKGSESVSIDLKKLQANESELYGELLADYPKKTVRKAYLRITAKD